MRRISSNMSHFDLQRAMRKQEHSLNNINNQIGSQEKIQELRNDPLAAGHGVRYQSYLSRLERFEKNTSIVNDQFKVSEGYVNNTIQILQRLRELSLTGATGTFNKDDLKNMAVEVDELLQEILANGNAVGPDGGYLFSGTKTSSKSFTTVMGSVPGADSPVITKVMYQGSLEENQVEIDERAHINVDNVGSRIFWAENQQIYSQVDSSNYQVPQDTSIYVDNIKINLTQGDNVYSVIAKINDSGAPVKAHIDSITNGIDLEATSPHQIWLQDSPGSNVLADLGLITRDQQPPYNVAQTATSGGGSVFDVVIGIRDAMYSGDYEYLGGRGIRGLDGALDNMTTKIAELGSKTERIEMAQARLDRQIPNVTGWEARELDLDFAEAVTNLKMMDYIQKATMGTIGRLYSNSLLNYLK